LRDYEFVVVVSPQVPDESVPAVLERFTKFIADRGGTVGNVNRWGRRKLAYKIKQFKDGNYVQADFKLDPKHLHDLEEGLRISEDVIRHIVIKKE